VLPSPNGSAIAATAAANSTVVAASVRHANAVARWLAAHGFEAVDQPVGVIATGERRPDGSLRPTLEDLLGAGGVVAALLKCGGEAPSPEAAMAVAAFAGTSDPAPPSRPARPGASSVRLGLPKASLSPRSSTSATWCRSSPMVLSSAPADRQAPCPDRQR